MFGSKRGLLTYLHDVGMAALSFLISLTLRLGQDILVWPREVVVFGLLAFTGVSALVFLSMRLDRTVWRYASMSDLSRIVRAVVLCITLFLAVQFLATRLDDFPRSFLVIEFFVLTLLLAGPRFAYRLVKDGAFSSLFERNAANRIPVLLIGAGDGSDAFIREMGRERDAPYRAVGIVDDRGGRVGRAIRGVPVLGTLKELDEVVAGLRKRDTAPQRLVITRQSIDGAVVRGLLDKANELGLAVGRMPKLGTLEGADGEAETVRSVSVEDLLGRPQKVLDRKGVSDLIQGRRVLVTGAGGTIGGELSRQIAALGPAELAAAAEELAKSYKAKFSVIEGEALLTENFPMIHAVGRAASRHHAPRLIELNWGREDAPRVALVGKGVAFDSGGLDIKSAAGMKLMKKDMGGAAHAIALAGLVMGAGLDIRLQLLVPAVENAIAGNAFRPGDVLRSRKGLSVEIGNTDAEGRLILADALALASEGDPALIIDFATLTGAARVALGPDLAALFTRRDETAAELLAGGTAKDDPVWRLPIHAPYADYLKSDIADTNNAHDNAYAGASVAASFLDKFVGANRDGTAIDWAHFDTFAWRPFAKPGRPKGGEALGLRAAWHMLQARYGPEG